MKTIRLRVDEILSDRNQYKPYMARLSNDKLFVEVTIGDHNVVRQDNEETVLTVDGLASVLGQVATAIENMHEAYKKQKFNM